MAAHIRHRLLTLFSSVCLLCAGQAQGERLLGAATSLNNNGDLLTNRHVVDGCDSLAIRTQESPTPLAAQLIGKSRKFDLAVIRASGHKPTSVVWLSVSPQKYVYVPTPGMKLLYGGPDNAAGADMSVNIGNGQAAEGSKDIYVSWMRSDAGLEASGSGVFDHSGSMVGVLFSVAQNYYRRTARENFYGENLVRFYNNNNSVTEFLQKELSEARVEIFYRTDPAPANGMVVKGQIFNATAFVICQ